MKWQSEFLSMKEEAAAENNGPGVISVFEKLS